jgi:hypothetical protein
VRTGQNLSLLPELQPSCPRSTGYAESNWEGTRTSSCELPT